VIVIFYDRVHRAIAVAALGSIGLATGCSSIQSIDGGAPAAAIGSDESQLVAASTVPVAPSSSLGLQELLLQDRFVPLRVALERSSLLTVIDGLDDFVLVAPIGEAFASSGADIGIEYPTLMNDLRTLEAVMRYHVVADPSTNHSWRTLNGAVLDADGNDESIRRVNGVDVIDRIGVRNGTILVVSRLLIPSS
jgi:uncharacterized surface protein with fasciclin (FAS1) repeats